MKHISFFPIQHFGLRCAALLSACCLLLLAGCKDDDGGEGATMTINKIYLENAKATDSITDREVTFARLGQLIRIEGSGFTGLKHIYINGYDTYFNNALLTDNNVWVTLNAKTPVDKADASVRNKITLTKTTATRSPMTSPFVHQHLPSAASTTHCHSPVRKSLSMVPIFRRPQRSRCPVA